MLLDKAVVVKAAVDAREVPPLGASNHSKVAPEGPLAVSTVLSPFIFVRLPLIEGRSIADTSTFPVEEQLVAVYVPVLIGKDISGVLRQKLVLCMFRIG